MTHTPGEIAIRLSNVTKQFNEDVRGLDDVSFAVPKGQRLVLLGKSGSGKSTMLRTMNRLQQPTSGTVEINGRDINEVGRRDLRRTRREIGFIFQNFHLVGSITALENVCTGFLGGLLGPRSGLWMYPKSDRRRALELLDRVGLADRAFQRTDTLSGGQQQRVAIARALAQNPSILLADEPVASLDPDSSAAVLELLTRVSDEDRLTVVCSLHQVEYALGFGERIIGLKDGRVVLDKTTEGLSREEAMTIYREPMSAEGLPTTAQITQATQPSAAAAV
ncbi:phosphonate ABC transporter ATP-binding protein [Microbacterium sp. A82]|uniref:phosphonate ABC transporter ATP-binding protein n=1 Tax=unclassified Microbacterium TaxID=2609290 RepID=UPI003F3F9D02